jgi:hypothetical protein
VNQAGNAALMVGGVVLPAGAAAAGADEPGPPGLADLIEKLPAKDVAAAVRVIEQLVAGGPETVRKLVSMVGDEFGDTKGVKPKYALHGVVIWASRPAADAQRRMVAAVLARELGGGHSAELKAFLCRQLQWCGTAAEVKALTRLLGDDRLCEPATQALLAIGGQAATAAVRNALPKAAGKRRATIVKAVGRLRDKQSASAAQQACGAAEANVRLMGWYAVGNIGVCEAADVLLDAARTKGGFERTQGVDAALRLSRRAAEQGDKDTAGKIARAVLSAARGPEKVHERAAALHDLAMGLGAGAVGDVIEAMGSDDLWYRNAAARTALKLARAIRRDHQAETKKLLAKVVKATQERAVTQQAELMLAGTI